MPSAHPASMGLPGAAIWEEIAFTRQDSLCIYLKGLLHSPFDKIYTQSKFMIFKGRCCGTWYDLAPIETLELWWWVLWSWWAGTNAKLHRWRADTHRTFFRGNPSTKWVIKSECVAARGRSGPHVERIWANPSQPFLRKICFKNRCFTIKSAPKFQNLEKIWKKISKYFFFQFWNLGTIIWENMLKKFEILSQTNLYRGLSLELFL